MQDINLGQVHRCEFWPLGSWKCSILAQSLYWQEYVFQKLELVCDFEQARSIKIAHEVQYRPHALDQCCFRVSWQAKFRATRDCAVYQTIFQILEIESVNCIAVSQCSSNKVGHRDNMTRNDQIHIDMHQVDCKSIFRRFEAICARQ